MSKVGRPNHPFCRKDRDASVTRINGKQLTLAKGKANKRAAVEEFYKLNWITNAGYGGVASFP